MNCSPVSLRIELMTHMSLESAEEAVLEMRLDGDTVSKDTEILSIKTWIFIINLNFHLYYNKLTIKMKVLIKTQVLILNISLSFDKVSPC